MANYACRRLRWPSGSSRLINATGRSPVPSLSSMSSHLATRQSQSFSNMTKFLGTSSWNALSLAVFPPLGATRQLGRTQYLSTTPTKLRSATAFPPSKHPLTASKHHASHYQRVFRHSAFAASHPMQSFSTASATTQPQNLTIQLTGCPIPSGRAKPTFSFTAVHNAKGRHVTPSACSHRFHPYQRIQPLKSDNHLKPSYRGTLRRPFDSYGASLDAQCSPSRSTQQPQSSSGPMATQISTSRQKARPPIGFTFSATSVLAKFNTRVKFGNCRFASLSHAFRSPQRPKLLPIPATLQPPLRSLPQRPRKHQIRSFSVPSGTPSTAPGNTKFTYSVAASYIAKGRHFRPSVHVFQFNPYHHVQAPKPQAKALRPESGQDAFFVSRLGADPSDVALGVADGVGGWSESGVDSADVSHALCTYMAAKAHDGKSPPLTARQLMTQGYEAVCHDPKIVAGGTTATVALLKKGGILEVANLGDSGYILLRLNGVHAASAPQVHAFNTPYQLSVVPPSVLRRASMFGGGPLMDQPRDAEVTHHTLRHGDVLILASDGVWDNLFTTNILQIVSRVMQEKGAWTTSSADAGVEVAKDLKAMTKIPDLQPSLLKKPQELVALQSVVATEIVAAAKSASMNKNHESPFVKEVRKYYPHDPYSGGKVDDICVVVAVVSETPVGLDV